MKEKKEHVSGLMDVLWTCNVIIFLVKRSRRAWEEEGGKKKMKWTDEWGNR